MITTQPAPRRRPHRLSDAPASGAIDRYQHPGPGLSPEEVHGLLDFVIRRRSPGRPARGPAAGREWALVETRGCDPGDYLIRSWTDSSGVSRRVDRPTERRSGGAIGVFTLHEGCAAVGPCPSGVDAGVGLLLFGFATMAAVPLAPPAAAALGANWLLVISRRDGDFRDPELERLILLPWALLGNGPL